jgi:serine/threonine protein kinase
MNTGLERLLVGRALSGRYVLQDILGRGGMSVVFRGVDETLERPVAVKLIHLPHGTDAMREHLRRRFRREAGAAARIPPHPHVVRIYDYGTDLELDLDFIVMELLEGRDLAAILADDTPPLPESVRILLQAASGIAAGHSVGVVHRDIKPGNIFLVEPDGHSVRMLDFGIAKLMEAESEEDLTMFGHQPHSPAYASPEQLDPKRPLTPAADVYQLGLVGYELIAGSKPFSPDEREEIRAGKSIRLPERGGWAALPLALRAVVERAVQPQPADRYRDARALFEALEAAVLEVPELSRQATVRGHPFRGEEDVDRSRTAAPRPPAEQRPPDPDVTLLAEDHPRPGPPDETLYAPQAPYERPGGHETSATPLVLKAEDGGDQTLYDPLAPTDSDDHRATAKRADVRPRGRRRGSQKRRALLALAGAVALVGLMWGATVVVQTSPTAADPLPLELEEAFRDLQSEATRRLKREGIWER